MFDISYLSESLLSSSSLHKTERLFLPVAQAVVETVQVYVEVDVVVVVRVRMLLTALIACPKKKRPSASGAAAAA